MDNLTHTLFAATLARTPLARAGRGTTAALLLASNAPDIDVVSTAGGTMSYLHWHRGPTHGVLGVAGLGALTAIVVWAAYRLIDRRRPDPARAPAASFAMLLAISVLAVAFHILMDLPTSYGTRLLSPFDWHWYAFDWLPIIDIYLLAALAIGLLFGTFNTGTARAARTTGHQRAAGASTRRAGRSLPGARSRFATIALVVMAGNYGIRATAHHEVLAEAPGLFGRMLPQACDPRRPISQDELAVWPPAGNAGPESRSESATVATGASALSVSGPAHPCLVEIAAVPTFLSPFRWRVIARLSNAYEMHEIDLLDQSLRDTSAAERGLRLTLRYPDQWTAATKRAAQAPMATIFLGFSRFPAARTFTDRSGDTTVRWTDVRFAGGITSLADRSRRPNPFNLTIRVDATGHVIEQHAGSQ